jgi:heme a synthase
VNRLHEDETRVMAVTTVDTEERTANGSQAIEIWLWLVAVLVFAMIVVGGATRLTDSGLSITEWQPILGVIPPLTEADWLLALEKYRQIPEYQIVNKGMSLDDFKFIYWWEWAHRFLGRIIGLAFAVPLLAFWLMGRLRPGQGRTYAGVLALGAVQGFFGWYMVKSGLSERVDVSQYRLALHLTTAFVIFGLLVWLALRERRTLGAVSGEAASAGMQRMAAILVGLVLLQVVLGAFVAGLKAGLIYNTWPTMDGYWFPPDYFVEPAYLSPFEGHAAAQFNHRMTAYLLGLVALVHVVRVASQPLDDAIRMSAYVLAAAVGLQMVAGIWTLLAGVPLWLGLVHQGGGALVLAAAVWHLHAITYAGGVPRPNPVSR